MRVRDALFEVRDDRVLLFLILQILVDHVPDEHVIMQYVSDLVDDRVLDPLFLNGLAMAALVLFGAGTLVIVVRRAVFAGPAFPGPSGQGPTVNDDMRPSNSE